MNTDVVKLAATKAVKANRDAVSPGEYDVDFWLHVTGNLKVGNDYEQTPTTEIPMKKAFALLVHYAGCTGNAGIEAIRRAMTTAMNEEDTEARDILSQINPRIDEIERSILTPMLASLPKRNCKGKVTAKLQTEIETDRKVVTVKD